LYQFYKIKLNSQVLCYKIDSLFRRPTITNIYKMEKITFPYDPVNRIQKLFYEDLSTIYNKNKLLRTKTKFIKYRKYCMKYVDTVLTPQINEWDKQFADLTKELDKLKIKEKDLRIERRKNYNISTRITFSKKETKLYNNKKNVIKMRNDVTRNNQTISLEREETNKICKTIGLKIDLIIHQMDIIRQNYKKCDNCEKTDMLTICECKLKHKLCLECIYDKTECPVCKEDLGLVHCDICMLNKKEKEIVKTGCKNEHKTCKECLNKIKENNNTCPFCREDLGPIHTLITYNVDGPPSVRIYTEDEWSSIEAQNPNVIDLDLNEHIDTRNRRQAVRDSLIRYRTDDMTPYNNFQTWLETNGVRERIDELSNDAGTADEVNISPRILDDVVVNNMNSNPTIRHISEENPFVRYRSGVNVERVYERGRGRISISNIYSREQAEELGDWTYYNEHNNWLENIGIIERIDELPNNVETREEDDSSNEQLDISDRDIELIMMQARCTSEDAISAFVDNDRDIVSAIMYLTR
jgi:NACalpha-BTF3-like transcription factor